MNDATTLRGWLAAWKLAHECLGMSWKGDLDPRLRAARTGTARLMPPKIGRKRARLAQTVLMVKWALRQDQRRWTLWAGIASMAYVYGFRIPSDLFRQWGIGEEPAIFRTMTGDGGETIVKYGPYTRKGKLHPGYTARGCLCNTQGLLCPHLWSLAFKQLQIRSAEGFTLPEFNAMLQRAVENTLSTSVRGDINQWTSHAFRRGSSVDILQSKGVRDMMSHGEWMTESSAQAYATLDEIETERLRTICQSWPDLSDDDR